MSSLNQPVENQVYKLTNQPVNLQPIHKPRVQTPVINPSVGTPTVPENEEEDAADYYHSSMSYKQKSTKRKSKSPKRKRKQKSKTPKWKLKYSKPEPRELVKPDEIQGEISFIDGINYIGRNVEYYMNNSDYLIEDLYDIVEPRVNAKDVTCTLINCDKIYDNMVTYAALHWSPDVYHNIKSITKTQKTHSDYPLVKDFLKDVKYQRYCIIGESIK